MASKKDFVYTATRLGLLYKRDDADPYTIDICVDAIADCFTLMNPRFNRVTFIEAVREEARA